MHDKDLQKASLPQNMQARVSHALNASPRYLQSLKGRTSKNHNKLSGKRKESRASLLDTATEQ